MARRKQDQIAIMAETMLGVLEARRQQGGDAYPLTLSQLAELSGLSPADDRVIKAVGKKVFTQKAVVTQKIGKTPSLDSPVYFKEDVPKIDPVAELARRMVVVLESQRRLGPDAYPPIFSRLTELCERNPSDKNVAKAVAHAAFTDRTVPAARKGKKPSQDALIMLKEDVDAQLSMVVHALVRFALKPRSTKQKGRTVETTAHSAEEAGKQVGDEVRPIVANVLSPDSQPRLIPGDVGCILVKGTRLYFLLANMQTGFPSGTAADDFTPGSPEIRAGDGRAAIEFPQEFREAFDRLDRRNGSTNFVKLVDLRQAMAAFPRDEFDAGLATLRVDGEFTLNSHEGLHGSLTPEEREAGLREAGSLLVYASRR
jgi:hypothetical protein